MDPVLFDIPLTPPTRTGKGGGKGKPSYQQFVDKFKPKLTTDDCYTPEPVYDAVLGWVKEQCAIEGLRVMRPFYPGGDYEAETYDDDCVVIDNPPFSIITKIVRFYVERGVKFFLFAPHLTAFQPGRFCTTIVTNQVVIYENGAQVNTAFVSNLFGDLAIMTAPDLRDRILTAQSTQKKANPVYEYPMNVVTIGGLAHLCRRDVSFKVFKKNVRFINCLDSQGKSTKIFGGGYLVSDEAAAEQATGRGVELPRPPRPPLVIWELSARERAIIENELL